MMPRKFDRILEDCLDRMDRGETLSQILAAYPGMEEKLEPLMMAAMLGRALPPPIPSYTALRLGKNDLLAEMAMMESEGAFLEPVPQTPARKPLLERWRESLDRLQPAYRFAVASVVVILAGGFFTLSASASGLSNQVIRSFFLNFEQVGELFWLGPDPVRGIWEGFLFKGSQEFPEEPGDLTGGYKAVKIGSDQKDQVYLPGIGSVEELEAKPTPVIIELAAEEPVEVLDQSLDDELAAAPDQIPDDEIITTEDLDESYGEELIDKEEEKEEKEELKDEEKELEEEEKEEDKEEKEDEKEEDKQEKEDEKEEDKQEKEDEKAEDKQEKEDEKAEDKAEKEADKLEKLEDKDKDK